MKDCNPICTPVGVKLSKYDLGSKLNIIYFKSLVGSLRYLTCTRSNILYGVRLISRFMEDSRSLHLLAAKRIILYIKCTARFDLYYSSSTISILLDTLIATGLDMLMCYSFYL